MSIITYFSTMNRKKLILFGGLGVVSLILLIVIIVVATNGSRAPTKGSDALKNVPLIDGHNDVPNNLREKLKNHIKDFKFETDLSKDPEWGSENCNSCHTDLVRLKKGKVGAQFWVAYVDCKKTQYKDAVAQTLEQIDVIKRLVKKYSNDLQLVTTADGIMEAFDNGKIGSLIAIEGGHSIDSRLGVLRTFYDLGARYMTLTHTCNTPWADSSKVKEPVNNLTDFGKKIIYEMNRIGMMVDLSHVSANVMRETIKVSKAPVIFSHSNSYTIFNHDRNVPDDVLLQLKENGGIIMINFYPGFVGKDNVTVATVVDHINYIKNKIGVDHIGIGADFDGVPETTRGLEDVSKYPVLFDLLYMNDSTVWSIENLEKIASRNLIRVFKKVEEVRDKMSKDITYEDWIPQQDATVIPDGCRSPEDVADSVSVNSLVNTTTHTNNNITNTNGTITNNTDNAITQ